MPDLDSADEPQVVAWIGRSEIDDRVWCPHIPDTDITTSEGSSTSSLRRAKSHVLRVLGEEDNDGLRWKHDGHRWLLVEHTSAEIPTT